MTVAETDVKEGALDREEDQGDNANCWDTILIPDQEPGRRK